jgi:HAD superfamily hydrolase (TIGR01509 family)
VTLRAVIFDVGGVLLHDPGADLLQQRWERRLGLGPGDFKRAVLDLADARGAGIGLTPEEVWWPEAMAALGLDDAASAELYEETWTRFSLDPRVADYVAGLRPRYRVASLSNSWSGARRGCVDRFDLERLVDLMVFSAEEGVAKPDPEIYRRTLARLGVEADEAVFVDDTEANLLGAARFGLVTVHVTTPEELLERVPAALDRHRSG